MIRKKLNIERKIILNITPRTWVRATQGDRIFFRIPRELLKPAGLKRLQRLEAYNEYKASLYEQSKLKRFDVPEQGLCISFFIPMAKSWKKWKKKQMHMKLHQNTPDLSNLLKAFEDSLCKQDNFIAHYGEIAKFWVDSENGWIELTYTESKYMTLAEPKRTIS